MRFAEPSPIWSRLKEFQGRLDTWQGTTEQLWTRIKDLPREAVRIPVIVIGHSGRR
jgi:hypothetical protein